MLKPLFKVLLSSRRPSTEISSNRFIRVQTSCRAVVLYCVSLIHVEGSEHTPVHSLERSTLNVTSATCKSLTFFVEVSAKVYSDYPQSSGSLETRPEAGKSSSYCYRNPQQPRRLTDTHSHTHWRTHRRTRRESTPAGSGPSDGSCLRLLKKTKQS